MKAFGDGIKNFYQKIVVPYYSEKIRPLQISKELALKYEENVKNPKDIDSLVLEV